MEQEETLKKTNTALLPHTVPLILVPSAEEAETIIFSGSGALVDTGKKRLLITCHHVWSRFLELIRENPKMLAAMVVGKGPAWVLNNFALLGHSERLDVSVLDLSGSDLEEHLKGRFASVPSWPPERPKTGDSIALIGFPSSDKEMLPDDNGTRLLTYFTTSLLVVISSVSDQKIVLADTDNSRRMILINGKPTTSDFRFGGMSGSPAFVSRDGRFDFAGIMYEGPDSDPKGMFFLSHAAFITDDGQINWSAAPFA